MIEDYAVLSDMQSAALVHRRGSIDWWFPEIRLRRLLRRTARWARARPWFVAPGTPAEPRRRYRDGSLVLETEWETPEGTTRVTDFMPPTGWHRGSSAKVKGANIDVVTHAAACSTRG